MMPQQISHGAYLVQAENVHAACLKRMKYALALLGQQALRSL